MNIMDLIEFLKDNQSLNNLSRLEIMQLQFMGNSLLKILLAVVIFLIFFFIVESIDWFITQKLRKLDTKYSTGFYQALADTLDSVGHFFYFCLGLYFALHSLKLEPQVANIINSLLIALIAIQIILSVKHLIRYFIIKAFGVNKTEGTNSTAINGVMLLVNIVLWVLALLTILANFGVNVTSLATSLGIGGIAIAFALQNILEDLFSSFSIYFDRPFEIGDFIVTNNQSGTVKKIGLKTTRITALQGEEIVISNKNLTTNTIQNFKKLKERRFVFSLGATYNTPNEKLKKIPSIIEEICAKEDLIRVDRATFSDFGASSLNFEIVLFFKDGDYKKYMEARERINLKIKEAFEKEGIEFAFPTQTLYINKES
jgi:small-conductance mechanosensitive channel